ncbi:MAG: hypothetical protein K0R34_1735 [Herbinix sp.]|jgi:hypothetical protein|nr:hypothetical protein [Herbinix sp.]
MKIRDGFILRKMAGSDYLIPTGNNIAYFNGIISLNQTALFLWKHLQAGMDERVIMEEFVKEYDITIEKAREDIGLFLNQLRQASLLED